MLSDPTTPTAAAPPQGLLAAQASPTDDTAAAITDIYTGLLRRAPEPGGVAFWQRYLAAGGTLASIRAAFATAPEAQQRLSDLFRDVLGRPTDPGTLDLFTRFEAAGGALDGVRQVMAFSAEESAAITSLYTTLLGHGPDEGGVVFWERYIAAGGTLASVRAAFAASPEAQVRVAALFQSVLGRAPDAPGLAFYTAFEAAGGSADGVRAAMADTPEAAADIAALYTGILKHGPDSGGIAFWQRYLAAGGSLASIRAAFAGAPESQQLIAGVFGDVLGHAPDATGLDTYTAFEAGGGTLDGVRAALAATPEAQSLLAAIAGPGASAATLAALTARLATGTTLAQLRQGAGTPTLTATLLNDTGLSAADGITQDIRVQGREAGAPTLRASLDAGAAADLTAAVAPDGAFTLSAAQVAALAGTLAPGAHTLHLVATGPGGEASADVAFTYAIPAPATFDIAPADASTLHHTRAATVTLAGTSTPGATLVLQPFGAVTAARTTTASATGAFSFAAVPLALGDSQVTVTASDVSGPGAALTLTLTRDPVPVEPGGAIVRSWSQQVLNSIQALATDPEMASRALAMESVAVADTVAGISGRAGTLVDLRAPAGVVKAAALSAAARDVLAYLFPTQVAQFDTLLGNTLATLGLSAADASVAYGRSVAAAVIAIRDRDGWNVRTPFLGGTAEGQWRPTAPDFTTAQQPQFATLQPWLLASDSQFRAPAPPAVGTPAYEAALAQVKSLGSATSTTRTADQTQIARFWNDGSGSATPPGHWDAIALQVSADQGQDIDAAAKTLAEVDVALADAAIVAWDTKFAYNLWRPITAIQTGDSTVAGDPAWTPLIKTPPHPSYVSGHSDFSEAAATVLTSVFGTTAFSTTSLTAPGVTRSFTSFEAAAQEAAISRVYAGIHFAFDSTAGLVQGAQVGQATVARTATGVGVGPTLLVDAGTPSYAAGTLLTAGYAVDSQAPLTTLAASLDGGRAATVAVDASGRFALSTASLFGALTPGQHVLTLSATDVVQKSVVQSVRFTVPGAGAATVIITSPAPGGALVAGARLQGTVTPALGTTLISTGLSIDGAAAAPIAVDAAGAFDVALPLGALAPGQHSFTVTAQDNQGGIGTAQVTEALGAYIPLAITGLTPATFQSEVGVTYRPEITFSRAVDPTTLTANSIYLTDASGARIAAAIVASEGNTRALLLPQVDMPGSSQITLHIDGSLVRGAADGAMLDTGLGAGTSRLTAFTTVGTAPVAGTSITGIVADPGADFQPGSSDDVRYNTDGTRTYLKPIAGVKVYILGRETDAVLTDANGAFTLSNVPAGDVKIVLEGRTATNAPAGFYFPEMTMDITVQPGRVNTIMGGMGTSAEMAANRAQPGVYLPRVASDVLQSISTTAATTVTPPADAGITLSAAQRDMIRLTIQPGSLVGNDGMLIVNPMVGVAPVPSDIVRDMLPPGILQHSFDITIQAPGGAAFAQPATLTLPNVFNLAPGEKTYILSFDHTTGRLVIDGTATASADGLTVTTDPGQGITKPGWHGMTPPVTDTTVPVAPPKKKDPPPKPKDKGPTAVTDLVKLVDKDKPVTASLVANDVPGTYPIDIGSIGLTSRPKHGTAVVRGGVLTYTSTDGKADSFGYSESDTKGNSSSASIIIKADCPVPLPLMVSGGTEEHENAYCKFTGALVLTNVDGQQPLLNVNGEADVWDDRVDLKGADVTIGFGALAGKKLLTGSTESFAAGTALASSVTSRSRSTDPLLLGILGVEVSAIRLAANEVDISGNLLLGPQFGDIAVSLAGVNNSTTGIQATKAAQGSGVAFNGLVITQDGASLGGVTLKIADQSATIQALGGLKVKLTGFTFTYDPAMQLAKLQGKLSLTRFWKESLLTTASETTGVGVVVDLADPNFVQIKAGVFSIQGSLEVTNITLAPGFTIPSIKLTFDSRGLFTAAGAVEWELASSFKKVRLDAAITIFRDAKGDLHLDGGVLGLTTPIPISPAVVFQQAQLTMSGINPDSPDDFKLSGLARFSFGPELPVGQINKLSKIGIDVVSPYAASELTVKGTFTLLKNAGASGAPGDLLVSLDKESNIFFGSASIVKVGLSGAINLSQLSLQGANVTVSLLNGALTGTGTLDIGSKFSTFALSGTATGMLPTALQNRFTGKGVISEGFKVSVTDLVDYSKDYVQFFIGVSSFGSVGLKIAFDGSAPRLSFGGGGVAPLADTIDADPLAPDAEAIVGPAPADALLTIDWVNDSPVAVPILLLYRAIPGGPVTATYNEAQFASIGANNVDGFGTNVRAIRVVGAAAGSYVLAIDQAELARRLNLDPASFDSEAYLGGTTTGGTISGAAGPSFAWGTLGNEDRTGYSATFTYTATGDDVTFYETADPASQTGLLLGHQLATGGQQSFTVTRPLQGSGYVFAIITDQLGHTIVTKASPFTLGGAETSDLTTTIKGPPDGLVAGANFKATITVTNNGTDPARAVVLNALFRGVVLADNHDASAAPASSTGTTLKAGDIMPGQTATIVLDLRVLLGAGDVSLQVTARPAGDVANPLTAYADYHAAAIQPTADPTAPNTVAARFGERFTADMARLAYDAQAANAALATATRSTLTTAAGGLPSVDAAALAAWQAGPVTGVQIAGIYDFGADIGANAGALAVFFASRGQQVAAAARAALSIPLAAAAAIQADLASDDASANDQALADYTARSGAILGALTAQLTAWTAIAADGAVLAAARLTGTPDLVAVQAAVTDLRAQLTALAGAATPASLGAKLIAAASAAHATQSADVYTSLADINAALALIRSQLQAGTGDIAALKAQEADLQSQIADAAGDPKATLYAAFRGPDGIIQRVSFIAQDGIRIALSPNTAYELTVFSPNTLTVGCTFFTSSASGVNTTVPAVGLLPDDGIPGADGLTPTAAYVVGVADTGASSLVPGMTDLAALQKGVVPAAALTGVRGIVGSLALSGIAQAITLGAAPGDSTLVTAYVATSTGLSAIDVSRTTAPVLQGQLTLTGGATDVAYDPTTRTALVATAGGLVIVDVSTPGAMTVLRALKLVATHVTTIAGTGYAAVGGQLVAVDLATGYVAQRLGLGGSAITAIARAGDTLFTLDTAGAFRVVSAAGGIMTVTGSVTVPAGGALFAAGGVVYVGAGSGTSVGGYATVDVSNPAAPALIAGPADRGVAGGVIALNGAGLGLTGQAIQVARGSVVNALDVIGTTDPTQTARLVTRITLPGVPNGIAIGNGAAFVADGASGLQVVNFAAANIAAGAPTVTITPPADADPAANGLQLFAGQPVTLGVTIAGPSPIATTELLLNGRAIVNDVSFPFDLSAIIPGGLQGTTVTLQVRATDIAGNRALSALVTAQVVRDTTPLRLLSQTVGAGSIINTDGSSPFAFTFSRPLDTTLAGPGSLRLVRPDGTSTGPATFALADGGRTLLATFAPIPAGTYALVLDDTTLVDLNGNAYGPAPETLPLQALPFNTTFINPDGGRWNVPANWSTGRVPAATDAALVQLGRGAVVTFDAGSIAPASIFLQGAQLQVANATLAATTIQTGQGATVLFVDRNGVMQDLTLGGGARIEVANNQGTSIAGTITDNGTIALASQGNYTALLASGAVTLAGTGQVTLAGGDSRVQGPGTLTSKVTITGAGVVGDDGNFTFVNQGVVDASGSSQALVLGTGGAPVTNTGILQSSGAGGLVIRNNTVSNDGGTIQALRGGHVALQSTTILGGRLRTDGGRIDVVDRGVTLDGVSWARGDVVGVTNNNNLTLRNTINNGGVISLDTTGNYTALLASGAVTLQGRGTVSMVAGGDTRVQSAGGGTLTNVDNTISGAGLIGDDSSFSFVNQALVDGNSTQTLIVGSGASMVNAGTFRASTNPGLLLRNTTLDNTAGVIQATATGVVRLQSSRITGGRIGAAAGGLIEAIDRGSVLDGVSVDAGTQVTVDNNQALTLVNNRNQGAFTLASTGNYTALLVSGSVGLSGSTVTLQGGDSRLQGAGTLTSTSRISGAGLIGDDNGFTFINQGVVDANLAQALVIGNGAAPVTNSATLQASGPGTLLIRNTTIANTGATIQAIDGGTVLLQSSTILGGRLHTAGGAINVVDRGVTLDTVTLAAGDTLGVNNNVSVTLRGATVNAGTIALNTTGNYTALLTTGAVSLMGGGRVTMVPGGDTRIQSNGITTLTNVDNTISGAGLIGDDGSFTFVNRALVDANTTQALVIGNGAAMTNAGTFQASTAAGLLLRNTTLDNTGGIIQATASGTVRLQSSRITGGRIAAAAGGSIEVTDRGSVLDGVSVDAGSQVTINDNQALTLVNNRNQGAFTLASAGNYTALLVSGAVSLSGSTVTLQGGDSRLQGAGTLTSTSRISGAGLIGDDNGFTFINQGVVDANLAQALVIGRGASMVNAGTLQGSTAGGLLLRNTTLDNTAGVIQATATGVVRLQSSHITGGRIGAAAGGLIEAIDRGSVLDGVSVDAGTQVTVDNNQALTLVNNRNQGAFTLASTGNYTALLVSGSVGLSGSTVTLQGGDSRLQGAGTLTSTSRISGAGLIGDDNGFTFINQGVVDANLAQALVIGNGAVPVTNSATLQASGPGTLLIRNTTIANTGATIQAIDGGTVLLQSSTILGGRLHTAGGAINVVDRGVTLDTVTLAAGDTLGVNNNVSVTLRGATVNAGTIALNTTGNYTALLTTGAVSLMGGGRVTMVPGGDTRIQSSGVTTLTNVDNTISGAGLIGDDGSFTFINRALVDANTTQALVIGNGAAPVSNTGTLQASTGGTLLIRNTAIANAGGTIAALAASTVVLQSATITGGTLGGPGAITTADRGSVLDGVAVANRGTVVVQNNGALTVANAVANDGSIQLAGAGNYTALLIRGATTLSGAGALTLTDNGANQVSSTGGAATLTNAETIQGAGQLGAGDASLTLQNQGTINATGANTLRVDTAGTTVSNSGTMEATGQGGLTVSSALLNNGLVWARTGGVLVSGPVTGKGVAELSGASGMEFASSVGANQSITFDPGATGTLRLDVSALFAGTITGLTSANRIDLADLSASNTMSATLTGTTLRVTDGTRTTNLALAGQYAGATFDAVNDGAGHVMVSVHPA